MSQLSTDEAFKEACLLLGGSTDTVIFILPEWGQADLYRREFLEFVEGLAGGAAVVKRSRERVDLANGRKVLFRSSGRDEPGHETCLRGLCGALFRTIPGSRDERHRWRWGFDDRWPGHYERFKPRPVVRTRFERIDGEVV